MCIFLYGVTFNKNIVFNLCHIRFYRYGKNDQGFLECNVIHSTIFYHWPSAAHKKQRCHKRCALSFNSVHQGLKHQVSTSKNSTLCPKNAFTCLWGSQTNRDIFPAQSQILYTTEKCVYCAVRTEYLSTIQVNLIRQMLISSNSGRLSHILCPSY
jgi:hypothetical protein